MKAKRILASVLSVALLLQLSPLGVLALDESLPQTPQVSTVQENLDPAPTEEPALVEEPAPTAEPTPTAAPTTEPTAEPTATPAAEASAPDAAATPAPEPSAEPTAAPDPAAEVQAMIDALPDEVTEDNAEAVEQALTDIDDAKESLTDDELAGLDLTRYDAAANALLALWGEAPADAVELLDNYPKPGTDATDNYYQIYNEGELRWFAEAVNGGDTSSNAKLMNNITLDKTTPWTPIGTNTDPFTGTFDGGGYTIRGLYIDGNTSNVGLFGYIGKTGTATGTVKNVTLADSYVRGNEFVGGICGWNKGGTLQDCHNTGTVSGTTNVGGVCGKNDSGTVDGCYNSGTVSAGFYVGGVCGLINNGSTLEKSYNTGKVSCTNDHVGGVCGWNDASTVQGCYNTGTVSGGESVGGVCGENSGSGTVQECYNTVTVSGTRNVGGVCGMNSRRGTVQGCYNTGKVSGNSYFGGVCGFNDGRVTVEKCYYLVGTSENAVGNRGDDINCKSKTETEFKNGAVAYRLQSDLNITTQVWGQRIGMDKTPVLSSDTKYKVYKTAAGSPCPGYSNTQGETRNHNYVNGVCSNCGEWEEAKDVDGYYEIHNQGQLRWFADQVNNQNRPDINARLMKDITMDSTAWTPIGTDTIPFTGTFDGNGHTISKLTCTDTNKDHVGLVGYAIDATIQNVTVQGATLNGRDYIGSVCGYLSGGTITNCHAVETVIGHKYCGGIVGYIMGNTNVTGCTNSGTVSGYSFLGGIVGQANRATVQRCFNSGAVTGNRSPIGGIVGQAITTTVQDCGNTGAVTGADNNEYCGGIAGSTNSTSSIKNCYNAYSTITYPICAFTPSDTTLLNCYYLADNPGTDPSAKTEAQFNSGEVAYLLQNGERTDTTTTVWGQTLTGGSQQAFPVLNGDKVYQTTPCTAGYSNTAQQTLDHNYTEDGVCSRCGAWQEATLNGDYYEIHNQGQLRWFADQVNNNGRTNINARLTASFAMDGTEWTPIGEYFAGKRFTGTFDGDGHTISGLTCTKPDADHVGLVGYAVGATIQNVTVQKSSFNGDTYIGSVCGYIVGGKITGCTNSDTVNVRGYNYLGGIAAHADSTTVQRCFNSGTVTGNYPTGGIVGFANNATVQDCGNTGAVKSPNGNEYCGGIAGSTNNTSSIQNCYNAYRTIVHPICASPSQETTLLNCYYLADNPGTDPSAKTEAQFNSGEVAYLLQNGERTDTTTTVWGQTLTGGSQQAFPVLNGDKVYQTTPCPAGYSNTDGTYKAHTPGTDGKCIDCKQLCISYTVTIPATVELGNAASATATISAENVTLPTDKTLQVTVNGPFTATLVGKTDVTAQYTIQKDGTALESGDPVLTANNGESPKIPLTFVKPNTAPYAGSYTGTVTFTVSVGDTTPTT